MKGSASENVNQSYSQNIAALTENVCRLDHTCPYVSDQHRARVKSFKYLFN